MQDIGTEGGRAILWTCWSRPFETLSLRISGQTLDRANSFPRLHFVDQNQSSELIWAFGAIDSKALSVGPHCS